MASTVLKQKKGNPPKKNLDAVRASTFKRTFRFQDVNGNPRDISNSTFQFEVRYSKYDNDQTPLIECTNFIKGQSNAAQSAGVAKDEVLVMIDDDDMDVVAGFWPYSFVETDGSGDRTPRLEGKLRLKEDVARK